MKRIFFLAVLSAISFTALQAQKFDTVKVKKDLPLPGGGGLLETTVTLTDVELYENTNYTGRKGNFKIVGGKLVAPFKTANGSFKVAAGKIVYFKKCENEFPYEEAYSESQAKANLMGICGVRSDNLVRLPIQFNGLSTIIHNNDCRRVFGDVKIKVFEISPDGASQSNMRHNLRATSPFRADNFTFLAFTNANANVTPRYNRHLHDANPSVPVVSTVVTSTSGGEAVGSFGVGATALRDGRLSMLVVSNIGSAHKTCDLCDDFSSNVRMPAARTESIPINKNYAGGRVDAANNKVVLGPYQARGSRDGSAITASGGTFIDFRVHLTVTGL